MEIPRNPWQQKLVSLTQIKIFRKRKVEKETATMRTTEKGRSADNTGWFPVVTVAVLYFSCGPLPLWSTYVHRKLDPTLTMKLYTYTHTYTHSTLYTHSLYTITNTTTTLQTWIPRCHRDPRFPPQNNTQQRKPTQTIGGKNRGLAAPLIFFPIFTAFGLKQR